VPEEHRATAIEKFGKDDAWGSGGILSDRQTDRQTHRQMQSSRYFATFLAGEVISTSY